MLNEWGLQQEGGGGPIGPGPQPLPQPLPPGWGVPVQPLPPGWGQPVNPTPPGRVSHLLVLAPVLATSTPDLATASTAPAAPSASVVPAIVGVLGGGAVGGIFGYIVRGTTGAVVGGLAGAVAGGVAGSYVGQPSAANTNVLPPGPYMLLGAAAKLQPGATYLLSMAVPAGESSNLTAGVAELEKAGFPVLGAWDVGQTPAGWPTNDPNPQGIHVAIKNTSTTVEPTGSDVTTWATQGASS